MKNEEKRELLEKFAKYFNSNYLVLAIEDYDIDSFLATLPEEKEEICVCSDITDADKEYALKKFGELTAKEALKLFYMLDLKIHFEQMIINETTGDEFVLSFKKI